MDMEFYNAKAKERMGRILKFLPETGDLSLVTLKGHLLAEEVLTDVLHAKAQNPQIMRDLDLAFFKKARLVQALYAGEGDEHIWPALEALNALRNELAHKLESEKVDAKRERFVSLVAQFQPDVRNDNKAVELGESIAWLLGCLMSFELAVLKGVVPPTINLRALMAEDFPNV